MRKVSLAVIAALVLSVGTISANTNPEFKGPDKALSTEIHSLLKKNNFNVEEDLTAEVRFTINQEGEIVVLSVQTENVSLEGFVKSRLNYKKVVTNEAKSGRTYIVPVRIVS